jgi:hypothetical protein
MKLKFVHIPKAGGSSIWKMLGQNVLKPEKPYKIERYGWHQIYDDIVTDSNIITFTISRNPYDRCVSAFYYLKKGGVSDLDAADGNKWCHFDSFEEFCLDPKGLLDASKNQLHFLPQVTFLPFGVDMTGSIENLDLFLDKICKIVNIKRPETIHTNKSNHADWKEYYKNPEVIKIVNDIYREDFIKFNYTTLL